MGFFGKSSRALVTSLIGLGLLLSAPALAEEPPPAPSSSVASDLALTVVGASLLAPKVNPISGRENIFMDMVLPSLMEIARNPLGDNAIAVVLLSFAGYRFKSWIASVAATPKAWELRKKASVEFKKLAAEFVQRSAEYGDFQKRVDALEQRNADLKKQIKEAEERGAHKPSEELRRELDANLAAIKKDVARVPVLQIRAAVESLKSMTENYHEVLKQLEKMAPDSKAAAKRSISTNRPDYVGEWLATPTAKTFLASRNGRRWLKRYQEMLAQVKSSVSTIAEIYNAQVDSHNSEISLNERLPRLAPIESSHGPHGDDFTLTPENPSQTVIRKVRLDQVPVALGDVCVQRLALLKKNRDIAKSKVKIVRAYRSQAYHTGMLAAAGAGLWAFSKSFEMRHNQPFAEVREDSRRSAKIAEAARLDIAGQIAEDKKKEYRLKPLVNAGVRVIRDREGEIVRIIEANLSFRDATEGKLALLDKRVAAGAKNPELENGRISESFEEAMKKVFKASTWASLEDVVTNVYTEDPAKRETVVNRHLTLIFREAIANLYAGIVDEAMLDTIESKLIPNMLLDVTPELMKVAKARTQVAPQASEEPKKPVEKQQAVEKVSETKDQKINTGDVSLNSISEEPSAALATTESH